MKSPPFLYHKILITLCCISKATLKMIFKNGYNIIIDDTTVHYILVYLTIRCSYPKPKKKVGKNLRFKHFSWCLFATIFKDNILYFYNIKMYCYNILNYCIRLKE